MNLLLKTLGVTATVDLLILFGLEDRGTFMSGAIFHLPVFLGCFGLIVIVMFWMLRHLTSPKHVRKFGPKAFAITFFLLQFILVREAAKHLMKSDVQNAKAYCNLVIAQIETNDAGEYPQTLKNMELPSSKPRLLKRQEFYQPSKNLRRYELSFHWGFDFGWTYSSEFPQWQFRS